jgi:hypothetical protein
LQEIKNFLAVNCALSQLVIIMMMVMVMPVMWRDERGKSDLM